MLLRVVIRFATSLPDVHLSIADPESTAVASLKHRTRSHLPQDEQKHGLRLIYSGRVLDDRADLLSALNIRDAVPDSYPSPSSDPIPDDPKGKGKAKAQTNLPRQLPPCYIHCAISSFELSPSDLALEDRPPAPRKVPAASAASTTPQAAATDQQTQQASTTPQARGFDRLLGTRGFSRADVAELRAQHTAMVAARHTPDTMPSGAALLDIEERWLGDERAGDPDAGAGAGDDEDRTKQLYDTLYGAVMGFFWPVGALVWGFREEGVWSRRRREMVLAGVFVNGVFSLMRILSW